MWFCMAAVRVALVHGVLGFDTQDGSSEYHTKLWQRVFLPVALAILTTCWPCEKMNGFWFGSTNSHYRHKSMISNATSTPHPHTQHPTHLHSIPRRQLSKNASIIQDSHILIITRLRPRNGNSSTKVGLALGCGGSIEEGRGVGPRGEGLAGVEDAVRLCGWERGGGC